MTSIDLKPASELALQVEQTLVLLLARLRALVPEAELHHVGATAIPGALTKGDVDILVRVSPAVFPSAVAALRNVFSTKQLDNWTPQFASFGADTGYPLPVGIQVVVAGSSLDFFIYLRDYFIANSDALVEYNRLKQTHAPDGSEGYWRAKDMFLSNILAARADARTS